MLTQNSGALAIITKVESVLVLTPPSVISSRSDEYAFQMYLLSDLSESASNSRFMTAKEVRDLFQISDYHEDGICGLSNMTGESAIEKVRIIHSLHPLFKKILFSANARLAKEQLQKVFGNI